MVKNLIGFASIQELWYNRTIRKQDWGGRGGCLPGFSRAGTHHHHLIIQAPTQMAT